MSDLFSWWKLATFIRTSLFLEVDCKSWYFACNQSHKGTFLKFTMEMPYREQCFQSPNSLIIVPLLSVKIISWDCFTASFSAVISLQDKFSCATRSTGLSCQAKCRLQRFALAKSQDAFLQKRTAYTDVLVNLLGLCISSIATICCYWFCYDFYF